VLEGLFFVPNSHKGVGEGPVVSWSSLEEGCPFIFIFQLLPFYEVGSTPGEGQGDSSSLGDTGPRRSLEASASSRSKQLCIRGVRKGEAALRPLWNYTKFITPRKPQRVTGLRKKHCLQGNL